MKDEPVELYSLKVKCLNCSFGDHVIDQWIEIPMGVEFDTHDQKCPRCGCYTLIRK